MRPGDVWGLGAAKNSALAREDAGVAPILDWIKALQGETLPRSRLGNFFSYNFLLLMPGERRSSDYRDRLRVDWFARPSFNRGDQMSNLNGG